MSMFATTEKERKNGWKSLMAILAILLMTSGCTLPWQTAETEAASESAESAPIESDAPADNTTVANTTAPVTTTAEPEKNDEETMESFQKAFKRFDSAELITYEGKFRGVPALCFSTRNMCIELLLDVKSNAAGVIIAQDFGNGEWRSVTVPKGAAKRDLVIQNINSFKYNPNLQHTGHNAFLGEARSCDEVTYIDGLTIEGSYKDSDMTFKAYLVNDTITAISTAANYDVNVYLAFLEEKDNFSTSVRILQDMSKKIAVMEEDSEGLIAAVKESVDDELAKLYKKLEPSL